MSGSLAQLRCCDAYLRSAAATLADRPSGDSPHSDQSFVVPSRRVLIVEFRDEVFADLKSLCNGHACEVERAGSGAEVPARAGVVVAA